MLSTWPPPSKPEEIPTLVRRLADGFAAQAKSASDFQVDSNYALQEFNTPACIGSYAVFNAREHGTNFVQALFMVGLQGKVWSGQFTGSQLSWEQALSMLQTLKSND
jgi:hypothetical protein